MKQTTYQIPVQGMHCAACELLLEKKLGAVPGVKKIDAQLPKQRLVVTVDQKMSEESFMEQANPLIQPHGYTLGEQATAPVNYNYRQLGLALLPALAIISLIVGLEKLGLLNLLNVTSLNLPMVFLIGVIASLSTCMASVGGLVLSLSSTFSKNGQIKALLPFHVARLLTFTVLGGVLGFLGSQVILATPVRLIITALLSLLMFTMGLYLLDVPWAKKWWGRLPKLSLKKKTHHQLQVASEQQSSLLLSAALGASTFFLPCGFTQSMQWYALGLANPWLSALTLLMFALGTLPVLGGITFASTKISRLENNGLLFKSAGWLVVLFALYNLYVIVLPYVLLW